MPEFGVALVLNLNSRNGHVCRRDLEGSQAGDVKRMSTAMQAANHERNTASKPHIVASQPRSLAPFSFFFLNGVSGA